MMLNIKNKIILSHALLVILLLAGFGYHQYEHQLANHIKSITFYHESASASLITDISEAVAGANYANIQMPSLLREIKRNKKISAFLIEGESDNTSISIVAYYEQSNNKIWRGKYPENYRFLINKTIDELQKQLLKKDQTQLVKINYLIARNKEKLIEFDRSQQLTLSHQDTFKIFNEHPLPYLDIKSKKLFLSLPTTNRNGGMVNLIFHVDEITEIQDMIIDNLIIELTISLFVSLIILSILGSHIIKPLNQLSGYIEKSQQSGQLKVAEIPGLDRTDEIGILAKKLYNLLKQKNKYEKKLKELSLKDPLTDLGNRRALENIFLALPSIDNVCTVILYIDIDNFKKYNDYYGHNMGDIALQTISETIEGSLHRKGDHAFRIGGEEFAVLFSAFEKNQIEELAEQIRKNVEALKIEHKVNDPFPIITISIGAYKMCISPDERTKQVLIKMLTQADKNLYKAKKAGRNRVCLS